jgi:Cu+-exporting ATPase
MKRLKITGMKCAECAQTIKNSLEKVDGVDSALVDFDTDEATIMFEGSGPNDEALITAVKDSGYTADVIAPTSKK